MDSVQAYASSNLLVVSPRAMEELNSFIDDLSDDIVRHAIDNALDAGVRTWNYVRSILNDYLTAGVKTVGEAIAHDEKRRAKNKPSPQDKPAKRKDWDEMTEEERKKALASGPFGKWVD